MISLDHFRKKPKTFQRGFFRVMSPLAAALAMISAPATAQDADDLPSQYHTLLLGQWCGQYKENEYLWDGFTYEDGSFRTYLAPLDGASDPFTPYWKHGRWFVEGNLFTQFVTSYEYIDGETRYMFPPFVEIYEIQSLNERKHRYYYRTDDQQFTATRNCDLSLS